jgi:Protein of unknown function (DUF3168)
MNSRVDELVDAAVDALLADAPFITQLGGPKVYSHVPQKTAPPYAIVLGGDELPWLVDFAAGGDSDNGARQIDVVVQVTSTFKGQSEVNQLASSTMRILLADAPWAAIDGFMLVEFVRNQAQPPIDLMSDGVIWYTRFMTVKISLQAAQAALLPGVA